MPAHSLCLCEMIALSLGPVELCFGTEITTSPFNKASINILYQSYFAHTLYGRLHFGKKTKQKQAWQQINCNEVK